MSGKKQASVPTPLCFCHHLWMSANTQIVNVFVMPLWVNIYTSWPAQPQHRVLVVFHACGAGQRGRTVAHLLWLSIVISMVGGVRASPLLPVRNALHGQSHRLKKILLTVNNKKRRRELHHNTSANNMLPSGSSLLCSSPKPFGRRLVAFFSALPRDSGPAAPAFPNLSLTSLPRACTLTSSSSRRPRSGNSDQRTRSRAGTSQLETSHTQTRWCHSAEDKVPMTSGLRNHYGFHLESIVKKMHLWTFIRITGRPSPMLAVQKLQNNTQGNTVL